MCRSCTPRRPDLMLEYQDQQRLLTVDMTCPNQANKTKKRGEKSTKVPAISIPMKRKYSKLWEITKQCHMGKRIHSSKSYVRSDKLNVFKIATETYWLLSPLRVPVLQYISLYYEQAKTRRKALADNTSFGHRNFYFYRTALYC